MEEVPDIPGAAEVVAWFGHWPSFHDAEVLSITLDRAGETRVVIHVSEMAKEAVITFLLHGFPLDGQGLTKNRIQGFNHQNVLASAALTRTPSGYELALENCYGVDAVILAERVRVELAPGAPTRS